MKKKQVPKEKRPLSNQAVEKRIFLLRGQKIMIDRDIATLYSVETKYLNRQVKRNVGRFPHEFMFKLTKNEKNELVTNCHRFSSMKHSSALPHAFTEHGVAMLASILKSNKAIKISILIIKTFIRLRNMLKTHRELSSKLSNLKQRVGIHDREIQAIVEAMRQLMTIPEKPKRKIGFYKG